MAMRRSPADLFIEWRLSFNGIKKSQVEHEGKKFTYFAKVANTGKPPVVLIHGIGANARHWHEIMIQLKRQGHSVFAVDLPSHGTSDDLHEVMNPDTLFSSFVQILEKLGLREFVLIGNSLGGALSLRYGLEYPDRLSGLVLISPAAGFGVKEDWETLRSTLRFKSVKDAEAFVLRVFRRRPLLISLISRLFLRTMGRKGIQELIEYTTFEHFQPKVRFERLPAETLLIWGKCEKVFHRGHLLRLKEELPVTVTFEEPENIAHCPQLDSPSWFKARLAEFLLKIPVNLE